MGIAAMPDWKVTGESAERNAAANLGSDHWDQGLFRI